MELFCSGLAQGAIANNQSVAIIALALSAAGTLAAAFFWMGRLSNRADNMEGILRRLDVIIENLNTQINGIKVDLGVLRSGMKILEVLEKQRTNHESHTSPENVS